MRPIVYDIAVSLDGFIAGPNGDVSSFLFEGDHVPAYQARLQSYGTVVMGRETYEIGYRFGLTPGARAYPHMDHHVVSTTLELPPGSDVFVVKDDFEAHVRGLRAGDGDPIYLCGGGRLAGALLRAGLVDRMILKVNPIVLGDGVRLFEGGPIEAPPFRLTTSTAYANGVALLEYEPS